MGGGPACAVRVCGGIDEVAIEAVVLEEGREVEMAMGDCEAMVLEYMSYERVEPTDGERRPPECGAGMVGVQLNGNLPNLGERPWALCGESFEDAPLAPAEGVPRVVLHGSLSPALSARGSRVDLLSWVILGVRGCVRASARAGARERANLMHHAALGCVHH